MIVGSLGGIIFLTSTDSPVFTPSQLTIERTASYAEHQVVGAQPRLEFSSAGLATITLPISLRADMGINPLIEAELLTQLCKAGKVLPLILAGYRLPDVVIVSITQTWTYIAPGGVGPYIMDLSLTLKEYV